MSCQSKYAQHTPHIPQDHLQSKAKCRPIKSKFSKIQVWPHKTKQNNILFVCQKFVGPSVCPFSHTFISNGQVGRELIWIQSFLGIFLGSSHNFYPTPQNIIFCSMHPLNTFFCTNTFHVCFQILPYLPFIFEAPYLFSLSYQREN